MLEILECVVETVKTNTKSNSVILREIAQNLKEGHKYGTWRDGRLGRYFDCALSYDYGLSNGRERPMWFWQHYGRSAESANMRNLAWLLRVIFKMTPGEFCERYTMV